MLSTGPATLAFHYLFDHAAVDVRQTPVDAVVIKGQLFMIEPQQVENRQMVTE
jgi:hypothetical protein